MTKLLFPEVLTNFQSEIDKGSSLIIKNIKNGFSLGNTNYTTNILVKNPPKK